MSPTSTTDTVPATWSDARDVPFFRITARLFSAELCLGASVLLASYDDDVRDETATTAAATVDTRGSERELVPVPVRRTR